VALVSLAILGLFVCIALVAPLLPIPDPMAFGKDQYTAPSGTHLMGTDNFGRSLLSRVIWGTRLALAVGIVSAGISMALGIVLGGVAGYFGGWLDDLLCRVFDIFLLIPSFFLALLMVSLFGPSVVFIMLVIGITRWPRSARIMRAQVLTLRSRTFVQATRVSGASHLQALFAHIVPNGLAPVITHGTILMGSAILTEAGLSFLGMGDPNTVSWGRMIQEGQQHLRVAPWMSVFPGLAMLLLVCVLNLVGDGLNYALNPHLRPRRLPRESLIPAVEPTVVETSTAGAPEPAPVADPPGSLALDIQSLKAFYGLEEGWVRAADDVSLQIRQGESLGLVGESGCGKTTIALALMRVIPLNARIIGGQVYLGPQEILNAPESSYKQVRWSRVSMVFQSAMNSLDPVRRVGDQLMAVYRLHRPAADRQEALARVRELFDIVGIPQNRVRSYPHELSGGMRQRAMICLALLLEPEIILADEPTTALDVLVQDQILAELELLQEQLGISLVLISHDVGIVSETCNRIAVMYAGQIVEEATPTAIFGDSRHPYTLGLLGSLPRLTGPRTELIVLPGESVYPIGDMRGCRFAPRCPLVTDLCVDTDPTLIEVGERHFSRCHYALDDRVSCAWTPPGASHE
jgi:peptide/nickel transport system permease protein